MISVICPVFNEEEYIENLLRFFVNSMPIDKELIIIDGNSSDNTVNIIQQWQTQYKNIRLLNNPKKFVPFALNLAIKSSSGDPIIRLDAHTEYADDYFLKIIETFNETDADVVGGPMRAVGKNNFQLAVAYVTSSVFGIGDSKIHKTDYSGESDHVYLGAWKREIFNKIGFFDEELYRNQDDEFHYRAKSEGLKIILNNKIKSFYYPRNSIKDLFKQYLQYGLFKPLVLKKVKSEIKIRHLIPPTWVLYLISLPLWIYLSHLFIIPLILYVLINFVFSLKSAGNLRIKFFSIVAFFVIHFSYGMGFLAGLTNFLRKFKKNF